MDDDGRKITFTEDCCLFKHPTFVGVFLLLGLQDLICVGSRYYYDQISLLSVMVWRLRQDTTFFFFHVALFHIIQSVI